MTPPSDAEPNPFDPPAGAPPPGYGQPPPGYPQPPQPPPGWDGQTGAGYRTGFPPPPGYGMPVGYPMSGAPYGVDPMTGVPLSDKSKVIAGVLQLVLGGVGAGRWYTGHYGLAVAQLLTCGGLGVWALIDGIMMLVGNVKDPQGRPLRG